ncbi:hypothetical protein [Nitrosospira sp. Is2]|uniref:hypothetical protein n=1 Tax=Nitrosospira sp. Is2 TaxID=3080532 RepID=UPI0029533CE3|nr:hypothetical protein [Nitrosospira sp. Is2]WON73559.1 hypothetical protein R5L00_13925 [Nitrosospira sp. Is2]
MNARSHATVRAQQQCIPPLIVQWLDQFGEKKHDGHGGVHRYFSRTSIRAMEREFGREPIRKLAEYLDAYKLDSSHDGYLITIGHGAKRIKRR